MSIQEAEDSEVAAQGVEDPGVVPQGADDPGESTQEAEDPGVATGAENPGDVSKIQGCFLGNFPPGIIHPEIVRTRCLLLECFALGSPFRMFPSEKFTVDLFPPGKMLTR
jgi:hypothetical protein